MGTEENREDLILKCAELMGKFESLTEEERSGLYKMAAEFVQELEKIDKEQEEQINDLNMQLTICFEFLVAEGLIEKFNGYSNRALEDLFSPDRPNRPALTLLLVKNSSAQ